MNAILNIGLNNTNYSKVIEHLNNMRGYYFKNYHAGTAQSEYNGQPEQTAVISLTGVICYDKLTAKISELSTALNQNCIAVKYFYSNTGSNNALIYSKNYTGPRQKFNNAFFINQY